MSRYVRILTGLILLFVSLPTMIVVVSSFSGSSLLSFPPKSISGAPYLRLFENSLVRAALFRSLAVGSESALISLVAGLPTGIALFRLRVRYRSLVTGYLTLGFSTPLVVSSLAFVVIYYRMGVFGSTHSLAIALSVVNLPFLLYSVAATIEALNPELEAAAATLGAENVQTFLFVTLPGLMPGVLTGTLLVFIFGITDFLVSMILTTVRTATLPVVIYGSVRGGISPQLAAAGGLYIILALVVVILITRLRSLEQFLYRSD